MERQSDQWEQRKRRRRRRNGVQDMLCKSQTVGYSGTKLSRCLRPFISVVCVLLVALSVFPGVDAAFVHFDNCLSHRTINSQQLQFRPLYLDAKFDVEDPKHTLTVTVYGNVTGSTTNEPLPSPENWNSSDPRYNIVNAQVNLTTLFANVDVLSYSAWTPGPMQFCHRTEPNGTCPWGPLFDVSPYDVENLHAFSVSNDFYSTYSFASLATMLRVQSGSASGEMLGCIQAGIAPALDASTESAVRYVPLAILILVGIATVLAARLSPWSSPDVFHWTSNYGRDPDILRLVTPGFGDCLQYIQFVVLAGSLSLSYPGFYQPVVSRASWSVLMFNESFVSNGPGYQSLLDGVYSVNGSYGITRLSQLAGMSEDQDAWAGMAVWLCVIIVAVVILCQLGFAGRTLVRLVSDIPEEDLRSKNLPFTSGNAVRVVFNYFLLPIIALSMFQLVIATRSRAYTVALAVVLIVAIILFAAWIFRLIFTTKPRVHLFDHLPLLLAYGPLYNTYSDEAAPYSFIPFLLTFVRGIAIGAVQPSGIAQLVILAICEVILILTLHAFRPFQSLTSMNAYHTFFAVVRLITTLLMVAFAPSLGVSESIKGWIGYAVLLLHAVVLIFGFFLNSLQTMIEVLARLTGANRDTRGGLTTVFGMRQLSKRGKRPGPRGSMASHATALTDSKSNRISRTMSASSTMMLNSTPGNRTSVGFDGFSQGEEGSMVSGTSPGPSTPGAHSPFSFLPGGGIAPGRKGSRTLEPSDPYYRPPRARRATNELMQDERLAEEGLPRRLSQPLQPAIYSDLTEAPSVLGSERGSVGAAYFRAIHNDPGDFGDSRRRTTDYSTRESDFYYGVRGPALSSVPTRKLKTGPADPMSPVVNATGWFKNMFSAKKTKDKKKGFEVVRSTPLHLLQEHDEEASGARGQTPSTPTPYKDKPSEAGESGEKDDEPSDLPLRTSRAIPTSDDATAGAPRTSQDTYIPSSEADLLSPMRHASTKDGGPPRLAPIVPAGSIHLPSRSASSVTTASASNSNNRPPMPAVPRRSSKRNSKGDIIFPGHNSSNTNEMARMPSFSNTATSGGPADSRIPFTPIPPSDAEADADAPTRKRSGRTSTASSIYPTSEPDAHNRARSDSYSADEYVYSHPYAAGGAQQKYMPARTSEEDRRPMSTGRVVRQVPMASVYSGELAVGSEAELVEEEAEERRKNSMR